MTRAIARVWRLAASGGAVGDVLELFDRPTDGFERRRRDRGRAVDDPGHGGAGDSRPSGDFFDSGGAAHGVMTSGSSRDQRRDGEPDQSRRRCERTPPRWSGVRSRVTRMTRRAAHRSRVQALRPPEPHSSASAVTPNARSAITRAYASRSVLHGTLLRRVVDVDDAEALSRSPRPTRSCPAATIEVPPHVDALVDGIQDGGEMRLYELPTRSESWTRSRRPRSRARRRRRHRSR